MSDNYVLENDKWRAIFPRAFPLSLQDQIEAFENLQKETAITCYQCFGTGIDKYDGGPCCQCDMEGVICAYCHMHDACECG